MADKFKSLETTKTSKELQLIIVYENKFKLFEREQSSNNNGIINFIGYRKLCMCSPNVQNQRKKSQKNQKD